MWASVMCPIPSCKRYSASAATSTFNPSVAEHEIESQQSGRVSSGARRAEMLASGVTYYPPPPITPAEYNSEPHVTETGSPLLDITIEKIIGIVQREVARLDDDTMTTTAALRLVELHDRQPIDVDVEDTHGGETSSPTLSEASSTSSSLGRAPSKRQRNRLDLNEHLGDTSTSGSEENYRRSPASARGSHERFEKEMLGHLECDVCACLLHEPVTTPCQHVSHLPPIRIASMNIHTDIISSRSALNVSRGLWITPPDVLSVGKICLHLPFSKITPSIGSSLPSVSVSSSSGEDY